MTPTSDLLYTMVVPAVGGLAIGFPAGLVTGILATLRRVSRRRERGQTMPLYTDDANPNPGHVPLRGSEHLSKLGWFLATVGIAALIMGTTSVFQSNSTSGCLQRYIEQSSITNQQRAEAAELDRRALREQIAIFSEFNTIMLNSVEKPPDDQAQARVDFLAKSQNWDGRLAEVNRLFGEAEVRRRQNPVPAQPAC